MEFKDRITALRKNAKLSQEKMAQQLFVTRQAVSRWETGDTIPGIDMLKQISKTFGISVDDLLGTNSGQCQSCGMTLVSDGDRGSESDGTKSGCYCCYCYNGGAFVQELIMEEMIAHNLETLDTWNESENLQLTREEAAAQLRAFLPTLKRWQD